MAQFGELDIDHVGRVREAVAGFALTPIIGLAVIGVSDQGVLWYSTNNGLSWTQLGGTVNAGIP